MADKQSNQLVRALGLKEATSMTIGTVVGVGLFTCGSAQIGLVGSWIIVFTFLSLLISVWPCLCRFSTPAIRGAKRDLKAVASSWILACG